MGLGHGHVGQVYPCQLPDCLSSVMIGQCRHAGRDLWRMAHGNSLIPVYGDARARSLFAWSVFHVCKEHNGVRLAYI